MAEDLKDKIMLQTFAEILATASKRIQRKEANIDSLKDEMDFCKAILRSSDKLLKQISKDDSRVFLLDLDGVLYRFDMGADYTRPGYFRTRPIQKNVQIAVTLIHNLGYKVMAASSAISTEAALDKAKQLKESLPWMEDEDIIIIPYGMKKIDFLPKGKKYVLMDDLSLNLYDAIDSGIVEPCKCYNDINGTHKTFRRRYPEARSFSIYDEPEVIVGCLL